MTRARILFVVASVITGCHADGVVGVADARDDGSVVPDSADAAQADTTVSDTSDTSTSDTSTSATDVADTTDASDATDATEATDAAGKGCSPLHGASMIRVDHTSSGLSYCIDKTEVTNTQFNEYLRAPGLPFAAPIQCEGEKTKRPSTADAPATLDLPANGMSWCYAHAYCLWAGKRLCHTVGGGAPTSTPWNDEWAYACGNGDLSTKYPYGNTYDSTKCHTSGSISKANPECHGAVAPFDQLLDMVGNVDEYSDGTAPDYRTTGLTDPSGIGTTSLGGNVTTGAAASCASRSDLGIAFGYSALGFRCCADPK